MSVRPARTQISLGIRLIWSESSLRSQCVVKDPSFRHADSEVWSDWADAQADLSLRWAHSHFVGFVMLRLIPRTNDNTILNDSSKSLTKIGSVGVFLRIILPHTATLTLYQVNTCLQVYNNTNAMPTRPETNMGRLSRNTFFFVCVCAIVSNFKTCK